MNTWQLLVQLEDLLRVQTWPDGAQEVVFGQRGAYATLGPATEAIGKVQFPFVVIRPLSADADDEAPELLTQQIELIFAVRHKGDRLGRHALVGGQRSAGQGSSKGRGLEEVVEEGLKAIGELDRGNGVSLKAVHATTGDGQVIDGLGYLATRAVVLEALVTRERVYLPCSRFTAVDAVGAGDADLTWRLPPDRFDRREVIVRRATGATAPTSSTGGTGVTLASLLATSVTDSPGAGTFSYALFGGYDDLVAGASDRFSASVVRESVVVT